MARTSSALLMRSLVIAFVAAAAVPTVGHRDAGPPPVSEQARADQSTAAPVIVVAQGRCYNNRCY